MWAAEPVSSPCKRSGSLARMHKPPRGAASQRHDPPFQLQPTMVGAILGSGKSGGGNPIWRWKSSGSERYAWYRNCERYIAYASSRPTCHALSIRGRVRRNAEGERQSFDLQKSNLFTVEERETDWASCKNSIWSIHIRVVSAAAVQWIEREASNDVIGVTTGGREITRRVPVPNDVQRRSE